MIKDALALLLFLIAALGTANANSIRVADGDTIEIGSERYRLQDVDAPELHQTCRDDAGREWPCGRRARDELRWLISAEYVRCTPVTRDRFGRIVAVCEVGGRDLGEALVRAGLATAYRGRGHVRYREAEDEARREKRGIWAGTFEHPRDWRSEHPREETTYRPGDILPRSLQDWLRAAAAALRSIWFGSGTD
jgi:endonuclease YncB( thermonuclease family)